MDAKLIYRDRLFVAENTVCELIIWRLPKKTKDRPHGFKYRLHFGTMDGICIVRYDNEHGKGDHRHYGTFEEPYTFTTVEQLIADFQRDVENARGGDIHDQKN